MGKYTIKEFKKGDEVYHLSNSKLIMVVINVQSNKNLISCRWIDDSGQSQSIDFLPEELGKRKDLRTSVFF